MFGAEQLIENIKIDIKALYINLFENFTNLFANFADELETQLQGYITTFNNKT